MKAIAWKFRQEVDSVLGEASKTCKIRRRFNSRALARNCLTTIDAIGYLVSVERGGRIKGRAGGRSRMGGGNDIKDEKGGAFSGRVVLTACSLHFEAALLPVKLTCYPGVLMFAHFCSAVEPSIRHPRNDESCDDRHRVER